MRPKTDFLSRRSWLARLVIGMGVGTGLLAVPLSRAQAQGERTGDNGMGDNRAADNRTGDRTDDLTTRSLIGKRLRVIHPNQHVTMDYSTDRVNVEVDEQGLIRRISIG